jgi:haloalkane dehalogenase
MTARPEWFDETLYPFESHFIEVEGSSIHYFDVGSGPVLLMLHGNPTWSFLYRKLASGLRGTFRCMALDYPGFGLSKAAPGYGYTAAEHSNVVERFIDNLGLRDMTLVVHDWGGPIGMGVAVRRPDLFRAFVIGNTWGWPAKARRFRGFSALMGSGRTGKLLVDRLNVFVNVFVRRGPGRRRPTRAEMRMWRGPFPTEESRYPVRVFPREIVAAGDYLAEVERGLPKIADRPALILWADRDPGFRTAERERWEHIFPTHHTHMLRGAGHYWPDDAGEEAVLAMREWWRSL